MSSRAVTPLKASSINCWLQGARTVQQARGGAPPAAASRGRQVPTGALAPGLPSAPSAAVREAATRAVRARRPPAARSPRPPRLHLRPRPLNAPGEPAAPALLTAAGAPLDPRAPSLPPPPGRPSPLALPAPARSDPIQGSVQLAHPQLAEVGSARSAPPADAPAPAPEPAPPSRSVQGLARVSPNCLAISLDSPSLEHAVSVRPGPFSECPSRSDLFAHRTWCVCLFTCPLSTCLSLPFACLTTPPAPRF